MTRAIPSNLVNRAALVLTVAIALLWAALGAVGRRDAAELVLTIFVVAAIVSQLEGLRDGAD